jgi:demethylmenaquinone methyltransferase / 2-methoxy-6-polyprenyl-1,4-benzoquinol methylase
MSGTIQPAAAVRSMFAGIAHRYDLANHLLSFNLDRRWRARTVTRVRHVLARPGARGLDLCCGTGDLLLALQEQAAGVVTGADFCHPMLVLAGKKIRSRGASSKLFEADALLAPLRDNSLSLVTVAFGFRNLADYGAGLREMFRILEPGGMAAILEFSRPPNPAFAALYNFYSKNILPRIGGALSGSQAAYTYLPESVRRFPAAPELADAMRAAGFHNVRFESMTGGIVALHTGVK